MADLFAPTEFQDDIYTMRRMKEARGISDIPASGRFDFAISDLDDDQLESMRDDYGREGWGISTVFQELLSRSPDTVKTEDIAQTQRTLIEQGYAPPDTEPDGIWTPFWQSNLGRADRDAYDHHLDGKHAGSTPFTTAFEFLGYLSPLGTWRGLVSTARGVVEQAPQTAERLGILGSGAAGAAIGASVGALPGALIGAGVGLISGALAEFTGVGETEEDAREGEGTSLYDVLVPWEDYNGQEGTLRFFEDLGFVVSAASILKGGAGAISATSKFTPGLVNAQAQAVTKAGGLAEAVAQGTAQNIGYSSRILAKGIGTVTKPGAEAFRNAVGRYGLIAQQSRPLIKSVNDVFTPLAGGQFIARVAERALPGETTIERQHNVLRVRDLRRWGRTIPEIAAEVGISREEVQKRLDEETFLEPGPGYAGALDMLGMVVNPTSFSPWKSKDVVDGWLGKVTGEDGWFPYDIATMGRQNGKWLGKDARRSRLMRAMSGEDVETGSIDPLKVAVTDVKWKTDMGRDARILEEVQAMGDLSSWERRKQIQMLEAKYKKQILDEMDGLDESVMSLPPNEFKKRMPVLSEHLEWSERDPSIYATWMKQMEGRGSSIENMGNQVRSEEIAERLTKGIVGGQVELRWGEGGPEEGIVRLVAPLTPASNPDYAATQQQISKVLDDAVALEKTIGNSPNPEGVAGEILALREEGKRLQATLGQTPKLIKPRTQVTLTPANIADPEAGIPATVTDRILQNHVDTFEDSARRLEELDLAIKPTPDGPEPTLEMFQEHQAEVGNLRKMLDEMQNQELIGQKTWRGMQDALDTGEYERLSAVPRELEKHAPFVPREVTISDDLSQQLAGMGKTLVARPEDTVFWSDIPEKLAAQNVDLFAKEPELMDTLRYWGSATGFSPVLHENRALSRFRMSNQASALHTVAANEGVPLTGNQMMQRVQAFKREQNLGEGIEHKGPIVLRPREGRSPKAGMMLLDDRHITPAQLREVLDLDRLVPEGRMVDDVARKLHHAIKTGAALGGDVDFRHPLDSVRMIGKALKVNGWPGFVDFMRTFHLDDPRGASVLVGGVGGAISADDGLFSQEALRNAAVGAGIGVGMDKLLKRLPKSHYMYLPEHLHRASMALRYTFSVSFDLGRHMESNTIGLSKYDVPVHWNPRRYIQKTFDGVDGMTGDEHWKEALALRTKMRGKSGNTFELMDEIDLRSQQAGLTGFSPRLREASAAYIMHRRNPRMSLRELEEKVTQIEGYGLGRRTAEKSVNFFFFPFSFTKKLVTSLGDAVLQAPARALLIHHGFKAFETTGAAKEAGDFIEQYLPIADQMKRLNNLAYGIGIGRFFLQGYSDKKTDLGKATQALSNIFLPSGANTPISQLFGGLGDSAMNFFIPQVLTDDTELQSLLDNFDTFLPAYRDIKNYAEGLLETGMALSEGGAPFYQVQQYYDDRRLVEQQYAPLAKAMGYASVRGFMESDAGMALLPQYEAQLAKIESDYPLGATEAQKITNTANINDLQIARLAEKANRSPAEEQILRLVEIEEQGAVLSEILQMDADQVQATIAPQLREEALRMWNNDEFREYYDRIFAGKYGSIERVA